MTTNTNGNRAEVAFRTVLAYQTYKGENAGQDEIGAAIVDLATDLLHLGEQYGADADMIQRASRMHYDAERSGDDEEGQDRADRNMREFGTSVYG